MVTTTLGALAKLVNGRLNGDPNIKITEAATLDTATSTEISFATLSRHAEQLSNSEIAAAVVPIDFPDCQIPTLRVEDPRAAFAAIVKHFRPPRISRLAGISPAANIAKSAKLGENTVVFPRVEIGEDVVIGRNCTIHPGVVIMERCQVDDDVTIFPNVVLYENTIIGARVILHAGAVIGAYGFGYDTVQGRHICSEQLGFVRIESDVEIGANSTVDRGTYGPTIVGEGTKIDNLVMVAHNCRIGKHNLICSQVGIAGTSTTGDYVVMAGQVGVPDHVRIGNRAILGAKSGILRDVPDDATMLGIPATGERDQMTRHAGIGKLPEMRKQLRKIQRQVDVLSEKTTPHQINQSDAA